MSLLLLKYVEHGTHRNLKLHIAKHHPGVSDNTEIEISGENKTKNDVDVSSLNNDGCHSSDNIYNNNHHAKNVP